MRGKEGEMLGVLIARMGELSAIAQQLHAPITNLHRILQGSHKLYLLTSGVDGKQGHIRAMGILKVGKKNLFIRRRSGELVEMAPLCVLDFYVHESCQRFQQSLPSYTSHTADSIAPCSAISSLLQFPNGRIHCSLLFVNEHGYLRPGQMRRVFSKRGRKSRDSCRDN